MEVFGVEAVDPAPGVLGGVERKVDIADQLVAVGAMLGRERDADRGADHHALALNRIGLRERVDDFLRHVAERVAVLVAGDDHLELVAAQTPAAPMAVDRALEPLGDLLEQRVARRVAERIVDMLEAVEIEHQHRAGALASAGRGEDLLQCLAHLHAVGETGERIIVGKARDLLFGAALFGEVGTVAAEAAEVLVAVVDRTARERPPAFIAAGRSAHLDIVEGRARGQVEGQRALGIGGALRGIDDLRERAADNLVGGLAKHGCGLGRDIGDEPAAVGFPEPALPSLLEAAQDVLGAGRDPFARLAGEPAALRRLPFEPGD